MKVRVALVTVALGAVAAIGLTACGQPGATTTADSSTAMTPEASALSELGFSAQDLTLVDDPSPLVDDPSPSPSGHPGPGSRARAKHPALRALTIRRALARNVEHGEVVVKTKDGDKTIDVQRGTVTAINSTTVTVKSSDGFTLTWTFGSPIRVIEHRSSVQPQNVAVGADVGVAGTKSGSTVTASLLVIAKSG
ncbi:hypothetical protein [Rugosimonospora africana]|uniref:DUF5666 domain-containing protein n=1 Tax=Rugosimonospora africana TaxID=556532 RepID=A0A8J3VNE6_9ACTN|nr:hypothetical protein [Rugosimonospora africana]GIH13149.1 hypothetical protein Raf01_13210 [Rugosimonospora africana]